MTELKCPFCGGRIFFGTRHFRLKEDVMYLADGICDNCGIHPPGGKESSSTTGAINSARNACKKWIARIETEKEDLQTLAYNKGYKACASNILWDIRRHLPLSKIVKYLETVI